MSHLEAFWKLQKVFNYLLLTHDVYALNIIISAQRQVIWMA